jgi:cytochrome oxidase assembly protein ShyY1
VIGLVERIAPRDGDPLWHPTPLDSMRLWSTRWLVADSIRAALPYPVAPVLLRELPGEGVPRVPARSMPRPTDPLMHLSYAGQWFFFALVALVGPFILARARRRRVEES